MELGSVTSSSRATHAETESSFDTDKPSPQLSKEPFEVEAIYQETAKAPAPWHRRLVRRLAPRYPRVARVVRYVQGPRPKVDLPDPTPFLNLTLYTGRRSRSLSLEPFLRRVTRPFTNPWLFVILAAVYIIGLAFFARAQSFLTPSDSFIGCTATYWGANNGCGLNGESCEPFTDSTFDFRCPAACSSVVLENPRTVGNIQADYVPLIVGGGDANQTYRGDTFICAAAIQAGLISNSKGGCASLALVGNYTNYIPFTANGLTSLGFPTAFPLSYRFLSSTPLHHCEDLRTPALAWNIIVTALVFLVLRPKPIVTFWCLVCIGFWHVALFSQPMATPPPLDSAFGAFLPALFVCYAFWRLAIRFTLPAFRKAPIEASVWYLPTFWAGVLTNITMDKIPINRLVASDLSQQPGAITALIVIIIIVLVIVINQVRVIRKTGWLPHYLGWYVAGGLVTMIIALLPGLEFRLHHYIISMVLIPGTAFPTRLSAIYQGFLLGMFLNGVAAWGFDSILQTAADLQGDGASGSAMPSFITNSTNWNASVALQNQTVSWAALPSSGGWDGFSLILDDVERYTGTALNFSLAALQSGLPHFFRLAYTSSDTTGDYTMPATLWPNGTWVDPLPGTST
ncbi:uncharacterized protein C8Q71DRAFT_706978 [Rhodofomes roseus]|uniref:LCCL domain-containing protein n=1 Tax=Rhodofomes roseus TaxID=34475 RepID=A0ABQ8KHK8_9APHY|nr:uncharacterized protein C8Q71DRAFT_706978 [Rhodofomes roseus]KAH9837151.1 hypothetical protein C8Q71DRAFT_706978 [Rhodofomes roseus]